MKRDWAGFRITILLYVIVVMLPINYYFANQASIGMKSDTLITKELIRLNAAVLETADDAKPIDNSVTEIDDLLVKIRALLQQNGPKYISIFRVEESFNSLYKAWDQLRTAPTAFEKKHFHEEIQQFSTTVNLMSKYRYETMFDTLYISLAITMLMMIILIFLIRFYIHIQIKKHAIRDDVTGLYNRKYFVEVIDKAKVFSTRHNIPLSVFALSFKDYEELQRTLGKKKFEQFLLEIAKVLEHFFRYSDIIARIEKNKIVVIAEAASAEDTVSIAARLSKELAGADLVAKATIEIGYVTYDSKDDKNLLEEANINKADHSILVGGAS